MNIAKIAKLAGVSPATVSRYLNDGYVSREKREIIKRVIDETGYIPLASAQTLRTRKNYLIGVIVPKISSESVARMVNGITEAIKDTKYNIILANTDNDVEKELDFLRIFKSNTVDGVILSGTIFTRKHHNILKDYEKPFVVIAQNENRYSCVYHDDYSAGYQACSHLINQGCRKIGAVYCTLKDKCAGKARLDGFLKALEDFGLEADKSLMCESLFTIEDGALAMEKILKNGIPDGVFCATDTLALGARQMISAHNLIIGKDIKMVGVGDSKMSKSLVPPLSSVHLHYKTCGFEGAKMLLEKLKNDSENRVELKLANELIER